MRKTSFFLASLFLLQSCYTYKTTTINELEMNEKHKIMVNNKSLKVKIRETTENTIVVTHKNQEKTFNKSEIQEIRKRKFSVVKTIGLPVVAVIGLVTLFVISDPKIGSGATMNSPN